ncbi:MAG: hypothetical protein DHS20C15_27530 [Planctomycetota bacterium]|nr:MAG: hypothetical protein DHS20C15_27530 [Planctomycetota bacterium]
MSREPSTDAESGESGAKQRAEVAAAAGAGRSPRPLDPSEWARVDRLARRLHSELAALFASLPAPARHASGLARHLGIDRTTCQRAVYVVTRPCSGPEMLARLPGVRGLRLLTDAAERSDPAPSHDVIDALTTAIDQFQELIVALGGSLTRLTQRIALGAGGALAASQPGAPDAKLDARVRLFDAAQELTGRASECWVAVYVYRPSSSAPDTLDVFRANGLLGHTASDDAVPLVVHNFTRGHEEREAEAHERFSNLENTPVEGRSPTVVLEDFTSDPPPLVTARQPHEFLVQAIDERPASAGLPVDLMLATRTSVPHPRSASPSVEEVWALVNFPCRHMLFDVYVHRDLARECLASLDTHLWGPDFAQHVGDRWQTRFTECPPLQLLGNGLRKTSPPAYPRLHELSAELFARSGLDPDEFVGFRCEVPYPLWRSGYCISFDFTQPGDDDN